MNRNAQIVRRAIGRRIQELRIQRKLTQSQLAKVINVHNSAMSRVEAGIRDLRVTQIAKLAKRLGVKIVDIVEAADQ